MKQQTAVTEKIDPLMRIQEEIKEVERREKEYRQLISTVTNITVNDLGETTNDKDLINGKDENHNDSLQSLSPVPPVVNSSMITSDDSNSSMPSLALSVHSTKDDDHHSDDSGISASSSPVNGVSANIKKINEANKAVSTTSTLPLAVKEPRYIGPNCYNLTPEPPQQKLTSRTVSTPLLSAIKTTRQFAVSPAHKGVMQRFLASRGKLQMHNNNNNNNANQNKIFLNGRNAVNVLGANNASTPPNTPTSPQSGGFGGDNQNFSGRSPVAVIPTITLSAPIIERDSEGRPIRPGYVPVELKIQRELQDLKSRESELKKIRKIRQSTPDLLDSIDNENVETEDEDSDTEHCYGPGKLRAAKSIGDMYDTQHNNNSRSVSPLPDFDKQHGRSAGGMKPAVSLAQLCDLDPEEAPSSRGLIAQWENLIQQNA